MKEYTHNKTFGLLIIAFVVALTVTTLTINNAWATDSGEHIVETTFFGNLKDDEQGCGIYTIVNLVLEILTIGIGILGVLGITIVGIQYLTAKGNEAQTKKAKRRIIEIVVGLIAYVILYAGAQWLLPGGQFNNGQKCATVSDEELAAIKAQEQAEKKQQQTQQKNTSKTGSNNINTSDNISTNGTSKANTVSWSEKIARTAEELSWPIGTKSSKYHHSYNKSTGFKKWSDLYQGKPNKAFMKAYDKVRPNHSFDSWSGLGADCGVFVTTVLRYSGHDKKMGYGQSFSWYKKHKWKQVPKTKAKRGDVCIYDTPDSFHTMIYLGKGRVAEANHFGQNFGHISKRSCSGSNWSVWRVTD